MIRYGHYMRELNYVLTQHRQKVDALVSRKKAKDEYLQKELKTMKENYSEKFYAKEEKRLKAETAAEFREEMGKLQREATVKAVYYLGIIEKGIAQYFSAPIPKEFSDKVMAFSLAGVTLSDVEFEALRSEATSYSAARVLNSMAEHRTAKQDKYTENGIETVDVGNPYLMPLPDMAKILKDFADYKKKVMRVCNEYCGTSAELLDCIDADIDNVWAVSADSYFVSDANESFKATMDEAFSIIPEGTPRQLTDAERAYIDFVIPPDSFRPESKAIAHAKQCPPDFREALLLDDRYRDAILRAEAEEAEKEATA